MVHLLRPSKHQWTKANLVVCDFTGYKATVSFMETSLKLQSIAFLGLKLIQKSSTDLTCDAMLTQQTCMSHAQAQNNIVSYCMIIFIFFSRIIIHHDAQSHF